MRDPYWNQFRPLQCKDEAPQNGKEGQTVKQLDNELKELVKLVEQLQTELNEMKLNLNSKIKILEVALKSKDGTRAVTTGFKTSKKVISIKKRLFTFLRKNCKFIFI